jgi:AAA family ATP:ADP antiporter
MLSVFVVLGVVSIYNRMLDTDIPKHKLFYIFGTFYFGTLVSFPSLPCCCPIRYQVLGLPNQTPNINRILGWVSYCGIESFGSVMVSLFWSFANSNFNIETAKASYGLLVATAQVGSILGPTVVNRYAAIIGIFSRGREAHSRSRHDLHVTGFVWTGEDPGIV